MSTKVVRTPFSMREGSGTFFVYRRFAVAECNDAMKAPVGLSSNRTVCEADGRASPRQVPAKALLGTVSRNEQRQGIIMGDGILPFALRDQVRFVRTWSSTLYGALGVIAAYVRTWPVRTYAEKRESSDI